MASERKPPAQPLQTPTRKLRGPNLSPLADERPQRWLREVSDDGVTWRPMAPGEIGRFHRDTALT